MNKNYEIKNMNDKTSIFEEKLEKFKNIFSSSEELKNNFPDFFDLDGELEIEKMILSSTNFKNMDDNLTMAYYNIIPSTLLLLNYN